MKKILPALLVGAVLGGIAIGKGCLDVVKGSLELWGKLSDWWQGAEGAANNLLKMLEKIGKTPSNKKISKSDLIPNKKLMDLQGYS